MNTIPPGDWVTVDEALKLVPDVSRRRLQALARATGTVRVASVLVLGRLLLDRRGLLAWRAGRKPGRPRKL